MGIASNGSYISNDMHIAIAGEIVSGLAINGIVVYKKPQEVKRYFASYDVLGKTVEIGTGTRSPDNPYTFNSVGTKEGKILLRNGQSITEIPITEPLLAMGGIRNDLSTRYIKEIICNGATTVNLNGQAAAFTEFQIPTTDKQVGMDTAISTRFERYAGATTNNVIRGTTASKNIIIKIGQVLTVAEFKGLLQQWYDDGKPLIVHYPLATPVPQDIVKPNIIDIGQPLVLLNEVQGEVQYTRDETPGSDAFGLLDINGDRLFDSDNNRLLVRGDL